MNNPQIIATFISTIMDTWWKITERFNKSTSFGLVTFSTDEQIQFDLNTNWNLSQYLHEIDDIFITDNFRGQTNTLGALDVTLDVFNSSQHYIDGDWQRLAILVTDGEPTVEPIWALYGVNPCQYEYNMNDRYYNMGVFLWAGLIGNNVRSGFLDCFNPSRSRIKEVNDYQCLNAEISGIVGQVECKPTISLIKYHDTRT